jgi:hypothetical protein
MKPVRRLLLASALPILVGGCSITSDRDVRAYNNCLARHSQDAVVCEGPRQAYEVDPSDVQARSASGGPAAGHGYGEATRSFGPLLPPVPASPKSTASSGSNG